MVWSWVNKTIQDKKRAHCRWKIRGFLSDFIEFKRLRALYIKISRSKYREYISIVQDNLKKNIRSFWSFVKHLNNDSYIPSETFLNDNIANNDSETCNLFSQYFGSTYCNTDVINDIPRDNATEETISQLHVSTEQIRTIISNLIDSANSGSDNVSAVFIIEFLKPAISQIPGNFHLYIPYIKTAINMTLVTTDQYRLSAVFQRFWMRLLRTNSPMYSLSNL